MLLNDLCMILNAFSAWMREAIKAKEEEGKIIKYKKFEEWLECIRSKKCASKIINFLT